MLNKSRQNCMEIEEIKNIVAQGESDTIEFKKTTGQLERGMETLCAFLNGKGGVVLFGVTDDCHIYGQDVADSTRKDIAECLKYFQPTPVVDISCVPIPESNKKVIAIHADGDRIRRPYYYKNTAYWRVQSTTSPMPLDWLEDMLMIKDGNRYVWESLPAEGYTIDDIDHKLVMGVVNLGIYHNRLPENTSSQSVEEILHGFHLYTKDGKLTNAAIALFGKELMPDYPQCLLRMAKFNGTKTTDDFRDSRQARGNIFVLLNEAMEFFVKHLNISGGVDPVTWQREDELDIPRRALRESIINACAHRLYHQRGSSISIAIFDDRIEVGNSGTFPAGITEESLLTNDESVPMNPLIADVLYKTSYLEHWGRGIKLMTDLCKEKGLSAPTFTTTGRSVKATFFFPTENVTSKTEDVTRNVPNNIENVPNNVPDGSENVPNDKFNEEDVPNKLNAQVRRDMILQLIGVNPKSTTDELAETLRVSRKTITRDLLQLSRDGRLTRKGGSFGGEWIINNDTMQ